MLYYTAVTSFFLTFALPLRTKHEHVAEIGRNSVSEHQIQPEYRDEQADAGRDG